MKSLSNYVAFDQALSNTGVAVSIDNQLIATCLSTDSKESTGDRMLRIERFVSYCFKNLCPEKIFYEYVHPGNGKGTPYESIKVLGLFEKIIADFRLPSRCFRSKAKEKNSWRSIIETSSKKSDLQDKLGLRGKANNNITDALGILGAGLIIQNEVASPSEFYKLTETVYVERDPYSIF
jgi:hypothetical protein